MKSFTLNGRPYDFKTVQANYKRFSGRIPRVLGTIGVNFFKDSFRRQGWLDKKTERWPKRRPGAKRNEGRAILIDKGRLLNSIILAKANNFSSIIAAQAPYAAAHNDGFKGTVSVKAHTSAINRKVKVSYSNIESRKVTSRAQTLQTGSRKVRAYSRKMNLPKRQFMGDSEVMFKKFDVALINAIDKIFTN